MRTPRPEGVRSRQYFPATEMNYSPVFRVKAALRSLCPADEFLHANVAGLLRNPISIAPDRNPKSASVTGFPPAAVFTPEIKFALRIHQNSVHGSAFCVSRFAPPNSRAAFPTFAAQLRIHSGRRRVVYHFCGAAAHRTFAFRQIYDDVAVRCPP